MEVNESLVATYRSVWRDPSWVQRVALLDERCVLHYGELYDAVAQRAGQLRQAGMYDGQRVALALGRSLEAVVTLLGVMIGGGCPCPLEPRLNASEVSERLASAGIDLVLFDEEHAAVVQDAKVGRALDMRRLSSAQPFWHEGVTANSPGLLLFTSGSTGRPKGVLISHRGLLNNAIGVQHVTGLTPNDRLLHMMPLYHTNGLNNQLFTPLMVGAQVAMTDRFRADKVPGWMARFQPTIITGVPTMYSRLLDHEFPPEALASLKFARCGSAPITPELHQKIEAHLECSLVVSYGLSEATCTSTINPPHARKIGSIGKALPLQKVYLRGSDGQTITEAFKEGEICIEGDSLMIGYVGVEADAALSPQASVLATGDLGHMDEEGYFFITGRLKDVIIRGGENLSPGVIEKAVNRLPGVKASCVIGMPHHDLGEVPAAFVVVEAGCDVTAEDIKRAVAESLSRVYRLDEVYLVDSLPENSVGKVDKKKLKERLPAMVT